jgi:hypothetical protein
MSTRRISLMLLLVALVGMHGCAQHAATKRDEAHAYAFFVKASKLEDATFGDDEDYAVRPGSVVGPTQAIARENVLRHAKEQLPHSADWRSYHVEMQALTREDEQAVCSGMTLYVYYVQSYRLEVRDPPQQLFGFGDQTFSLIDAIMEGSRAKRHIEWGYLVSVVGAVEQQLQALIELKFPQDDMGWVPADIPYGYHTVPRHQLDKVCTKYE